MFAIGPTRLPRFVTFYAHLSLFGRSTFLCFTRVYESLVLYVLKLLGGIFK